MTPKIIYDSKCPVCTNYMRLIKRKIGDAGVEYVPSDATATDFEYVDRDGKSALGTTAIEWLARDFPAVKDYMFALPERYRVTGMKVGYKVGSVVRKVIGKISKGCNCGAKRK